MENFDLESYYSELEKSQSINECPKVPLPKIREDQNYIFVSYAHTDYKDVYKTLAFLYANGVRFWYDSGLTYGKNWDDEVRQKIRHPNCSGAVFFLSDNLFLSKSVINIELPCILGIDSNGEKIAGVNPLDYFSINLTVKLPGDIMFDIVPELRSRGIGASWIKMLLAAFEDETTYISPREFDYEGKLLEHISKKFNVTEVAPNSVFEKPIYYGEYKDGKYHGKGKLIFPKGGRRDLYYGEFHEGKIRGNGYLFFKNGTVIIGEWEGRNIVGGRVVIRYPDGAVNEFECTAWGVDHHGAYRSAAGRTFSKECAPEYAPNCSLKDLINGTVELKNNKLNGYGWRLFANRLRILGLEEIYIGEWNGGKRSGRGMYRDIKGNVYDGEWKDDKRNGRGVWRAGLSYDGVGNVYDGEWKDDKHNGHGKMLYANGDVYEGEWQDGKRDGFGILTKPDGRVVKGIWKDGKLVQKQDE